jgi:hypothetical protein
MPARERAHAAAHDDLSVNEERKEEAPRRQLRDEICQHVYLCTSKACKLTH